MRSFPKPDARAKAVVASLVTVAAVVALAVWRPPGILSVVLALVCVVLGMIAGVTITAARQPVDDGGHTPSPKTWLPEAGYGVDADTLEAIDPRAVRNLRAPGGHPVDADTLEALDPRAVRGLRAQTAVDADTLETLDPRAVRQGRGVSDR
ncbi:hypothetical protein ACFWDK_04135 [Micromonospora chalcea]|uniref:hypothetical protein n=1 Tax=Micromonospora sp. TSRI0369 TaxID=1703936 RepID=UPI000939196C|nr:hypothetical protein [Micromonospora sp. TSRI0369]OKJ44645.1 hypothetical protein AMK25_16690 [Micromonospora sp. TSRI0369]